MKFLTYIVVAVIFHCNLVNAVVRFYMRENFQGLYGKYLPEQGKCVNNTFYGYNNVGPLSIVTDECIIAYLSANCDININYKISPGSYKNLSDMVHSGTNDPYPFYSRILSFQMCTEDLGLDSVPRVSFYQSDGLFITFSEIFEEVSVPDLPGFRFPSRISNHGSCIKLKFKNGLQERVFKGGQSPYTENFDNHYSSFGGGIVSISPCDEVVPVLNSTAVEFYFNGRESQSPVRQWSFGAESSYENNMEDFVFQDYFHAYNLSDKISDSSLYLSKISQWNVATGVRILFSENIPSGAKDALIFFASNNNKNPSTNYEVVRQYLINQRISMKPCTKYSVSSYVKVEINTLFIYDVTFEVKGMVGSRPINSTEICEYLTGTKAYSKIATTQCSSLDPFTALVKEVGNLALDYGYETGIKKVEEFIEGCGPS